MEMLYLLEEYPDDKDIEILISIGGPRCRDPQCTLTDWLGTVIDSDSCTQSTLPPYAPLMP